MPSAFTNERVYVTYRVQEKPYGGEVAITKNGQLVKDVGIYTLEDQGLITINVDPEVLNFSGDVKCELIILSLDETERFTSPTMTFKIEPSLVANNTQ